MEPGREGAGAMADQGHKAILDGGTAAWNKWRQENPGIRPDLSHSNIRIKQLEGVNLKGACLRGAMLPGADLRGANLEDADLAGADLMEADLRGAWMGGADLRGANMMGADLRKADLTGVNLDGAILYRADLEGSECAANALWLQTLLNFANGLISIDCAEEDFDFDDLEGAMIRSSHVSTNTSRLQIDLADPVSVKASQEILGALNRLYGVVSDRDLPGPIIQIGVPDLPGAGNAEE